MFVNKLCSLLSYLLGATGRHLTELEDLGSLGFGPSVLDGGGVGQLFEEFNDRCIAREWFGYDGVSVLPHLTKNVPTPFGEILTVSCAFFPLDFRRIAALSFRRLSTGTYYTFFLTTSSQKCLLGRLLGHLFKIICILILLSREQGTPGSFHVQLSYIHRSETTLQILGKRRRIEQFPQCHWGMKIIVD